MVCPFRHFGLFRLTAIEPLSRLWRNFQLLIMGPAEWLRCPILLPCRSFFKLNRMGLGIPYYRSGMRLRRGGALLHAWVECPYLSPIGEKTALRLVRELRSLLVGPLRNFAAVELCCTPRQGCSVSGKAALCPRSRSRLPIGVRLSRPYQALSTLGLTGNSSCTSAETEFLHFPQGVLS